MSICASTLHPAGCCCCSLLASLNNNNNAAALHHHHHHHHTYIVPAQPPPPQRGLRSQQVLLQLFHLSSDLAAAQAERSAAEGRLAEATAAAGRYEGEVEGRKKAAAGLAKERLGLEKKIKKLQADRDKKVRGGILQSDGWQSSCRCLVLVFEIGVKFWCVVLF